MPPYAFYTYPKAYLGQPAQPICQLTAAATVLSDAETCLTNPKAGIGYQAVTLTGASTLALPTNLPAGGGVSIVYMITHSGADGPTLASGFKYPGGAQPPACDGVTILTGCWSTTAGLTDWLPCVTLNPAHLGCGTVITNIHGASPFILGNHAMLSCADGTACASTSINVTSGQNLLVGIGYCNNSANCTSASSGITVTSVTKTTGTATIGTCVALTGTAGTSSGGRNTAVAIHQCPITGTGTLTVQDNFSAAVHAPTIAVAAVSGFAASPDDGIGAVSSSVASASATVTSGTPTQGDEFYFNVVVGIGPTVFTSPSGTVIDNQAPSGVDMLTQFVVPQVSGAQTMTATSSESAFISAIAGLKHP